MRRSPCLLLILFLAARVSGAAAPAVSPAAVSLASENDVYGGHGDRYYTNGMRLLWLAEPAPGESSRFFCGAAHEIYTPRDWVPKSASPDDHPYSAWLYATAGLAITDERRMDLWTLNAGVVGPSAFGEQVQSEWHRIIGVKRFNGWDTQLRDEPGVDLAWLRVWRLRAAGVGGGYAVDVLPRLGVEVGTVRDVAKVAVQVRLGRNLPADFGELRLRDGIAGLSPARMERPASRSWAPDSWYAYADFQGEAWARHMMLDGNLWHDSRSVDAERAVAQISCGLTGHWGAARVSLFQALRTREFRTQDGVFLFGGLSVTVTR